MATTLKIMSLNLRVDNTGDGINSFTNRFHRVVEILEQEKPDLVVAFVHWGSEFNDTISPTQEKICTLMKNKGVDAIIGTHPHYVQSIGFDPETGMLIAYSLGDLYGGEKKDTAVSGARA